MAHRKWLPWFVRNPIRAVLALRMLVYAGMALTDTLTVCWIGFDMNTDYDGFKQKIHEMVCWEMQVKKDFDGGNCI